VTANSFFASGLKLIAWGLLSEKCFPKELIAERSVATKVKKKIQMPLNKKAPRNAGLRIITSID